VYGAGYVTRSRRNEGYGNGVIFIRAQVREKFGKEAADAIRILYGGSVKPDNARTLMAQPEIDGVLVGGAALDPTGFASIVNF